MTAKFTFAACSLGALVALFPLMASAELQSELAAFVVTTGSDGAEQFAPAYTVKPGQVIEYRLKHVNKFDQAIGGVAIVGPVPQEAVFETGTQTSSSDAVFEIRADLDPDNPGEEWSTLPAMREVVLSDGSRVIEEATPEHFTAVRWNIVTPIQNEEAVANSYRVTVR